MMLMACQSDDTTEQGGGLQSDGTVRVHLKVGVAGSETTRAWQDNDNAVQAEMMNVWTVVAVNDDNTSIDYNKVVSIWACKPKGDPDQEIDDFVELPAVGTYRFYSFANMSPDVVKDLLGLNPIAVDPGHVRTRAAGTKYDDGSRLGPGQTNENRNATGEVTSYATANDRFFENDNDYKPNEFYQIPFDAGVMISADAANSKTVNVAGNNFDVNAPQNGYGAKGIPMSNVQTINVTAETNKIELIVIRMLAKVELQVYNDGNTDVTIKSFTLQEVTKNMDNNLKLLPNLTLGANTMDNKHGDIQPNLASTVKTADLTLYPKEQEARVAKTGHKTTDGTPNPVTFTFYVNESAAPTNASGLFYLTLGVEVGEGPGKVFEYRHALINQKGSTTTDDDKWDWIARNDYRKIPIVLTDWQFRVEPLALAPIAGYPSGTLSSDALTATFSTGGPIALKPYVKKQTESAWRDFSDPEVQFVSVSWKIKGDATENPSGAGKMIMSPFVYDDASKYIIGELNNGITTSGTYETAITVTVKLGPTGSQYTYSFTCNVVLQVL